MYTTGRVTVWIIRPEARMEEKEIEGECGANGGYYLCWPSRSHLGERSLCFLRLVVVVSICRWMLIW